MSVVLTSMIKQVSFFRSTKWTILPWKMLSIDKFINGSEPKIIMFFLPFFGGGERGRGGGKGGEVGVEEEDSSIPMDLCTFQGRRIPVK